MEAADQNVPLGILGHRAESDRLGRLTDFLVRFGPSPGEGRQPGRSVEEGADPLIIQRRNQALGAAFDAVERLAMMSFSGPPTNETNPTARPPGPAPRPIPEPPTMPRRPAPAGPLGPGPKPPPPSPPLGPRRKPAAEVTRIAVGVRRPVKTTGPAGDPEGRP